MADAILEHGTVRAGFLGVGVQPAAAPDDHEREVGLLVTAMEPDAPAAKAGLLVGDLILGVDGVPIGHYRHLIAALAGRAGQEVEVEILRGGAAHTLTASVGERPARKRGAGRCGC